MLLQYSEFFISEAKDPKPQCRTRELRLVAFPSLGNLKGWQNQSGPVVFSPTPAAQL